MNNIQQQNLHINQSQEHLHSQNYQEQITYLNTTIQNNDLLDNTKTCGNVETNSLINHLGNNNTNRNDLTNQLVNSNTSGNFYLIQSTPQQQDYNNQMAIKNQQQLQQPIQKQYQFVNSTEMNQLQQTSNLKFITTSNTPNLVASLNQQQANSAASRVILQQQPNQTNQPTTAFIVQSNQVQPLTNNNNISQMYLNINNRIVPIQAVNLKPNNTTSNASITTLAQQQNTSNNDNTQNGLNQMPRFQLITTNNLLNNNNKQPLQQQQQHQSPQLKPVTISSNNSQIQAASFSNDLSSNLNSNKNDVNISTNSNTTNTTTNTNTQSITTSQPQFLILSNNSNIQQITTNSSNTSIGLTTTTNNSNNSIITNSGTLSVEITEKMRELELIQNQLKSYQARFQSNDLSKSQQTTTLTQQQIQAVLSSTEQQQLQKLLVQRKTVQAEIQRLQQKLLLTPASSDNINDSKVINSNTTNTLTTTTTPSTSQMNTTGTSPLNKLHLYQQLLVKLNNFKNSKTFVSSTTNQKELRLTPDEFENYKKLTNLQAQLEKELALTKEQIQSVHQKLFQISSQNDNQQQQVTNNIEFNGQLVQQQSVQLQSQQQPLVQQQQQPHQTTIKLSECSLSDKYKILDLIDKQINTIKTTLTTNVINQSDPSAVQQQEQLKQKYTLLVKKQAEIQTLIKMQEKEELDKQTDMNSIAQYQQQQSQIKQFNLDTSTSSSSNHIPSSPSTQFVNNDSSLHTVTQPKQAPIKIRNVITTTSMASTTPASPLTNSNIISNKTTLTASPITIRPNSTTSIQTPLKSIVLNNVTQQNSPINSYLNDSSNVLPLAAIANLQKTFFPNLKFKSLNFDELAQNAVITKQTDETTIDLLKELDEKASQLVNPDQIATFTKNQVKLARKYIEQHLAIRQTKRRKFQEHLNQDHKQVLERLNMNSNFVDVNDAMKHLTPYHIFQKTLYEPTEEESLKFDESFEQVSEKLLKTADAMKKRFHLFQLRSMQKQIVSSEETLMLKLFVDDLKQSVEQEKKSSKELVVVEETTKTTSVLSQPPINTTNESQSTIRQILKCNNLLNSENTSTNSINNDFNLITSNQSNPLKRHLKLEDNDNTPIKLNNNTSTSFMPSSSSSSSSTNLDEKLFCTNEKLNSLMSNTNKSNGISSSSDFNHFNDEFNFNATRDDSNDNKDTINISGLDDLILNEDEMICQNLLDY